MCPLPPACGRPSNLPLALACACALAFVLAACGRESPTAPAGHEISGPVVLVGFLTDSLSAFAGTRVVGDADGILVELVAGQAVVASTRTVRGRYRFTNVPAGAYRARARVTFDMIAETQTLTLAQGSLLVADTLRLRSRGDLFPVPNPFRRSQTAYFSLPVAEQVNLRVLDLAGSPVRQLFEGLLSAGLHQALWDGTDDAGDARAPGLYWFTLQDAQGTRVQLVIRQ